MPPWLQALMVSVIVPFIAASVLKPFLARFFDEKAKNLATKQDIDDIVDAAYQKAYREEAAKRQALHDDIENVLRELKQVTTLAETIKTEISEQYWYRQMRWTQKRDSYLKVLQALADQKSNFLGYIDAINRAASAVDPRSASAMDSSVMKELTSLDDEARKSVAETRRSVAIAALFISDSAAAILNELVTRLENPDVDSLPGGLDQLSQLVAIYDLQIKQVDGGLIDFVSAAKGDLGLEPLDRGNGL